MRKPLLLSLAVVVGSGCEALYWVCDPTHEASTDGLPATLSATGLFSDIATDTLGEGVVPYRPQFELWSDGAEKRRWVSGSFGLSLDVHAAFDAAAPVVWSHDASRVQLAVQPGVAWRFGANSVVAANLLVPIGGALGGHALAGGIHVAGSL